MIYVDADACPVRDIISSLARKYNIKVIMYCDTSHIIFDNYAKVISVDTKKDNVDFYIASTITDNDILITSDYGLSNLVLSKKVIIIHPNGFIIDNNNINTLLTQRYLNYKLRKQSSHIKGHKKRTKSDDINFFNLLNEILRKYN